MNSPILSFWKISIKGETQWVCQARVRQLGCKPITVQRRHKSKTVAFERATQAIQTKTIPKQVIAKHTVELVCSEYLQSLVGTIRETTIGEYSYLLSRYFLDVFAGQNVESITPQSIRSLMRDLITRGLTPATVNTVRARVHALFNFAVREQILDRNVVALTRPLRTSKESQKLVQEPWSPSEARDALRKAEGKPLNLFIVMSLHLGLRRGEIASLKWGDFDEGKRLFHINKSAVDGRAWIKGRVVTGTFLQETKTKSSSRVAYCSDQLLKAIYQERMRFLAITGVLPGPNDPLIFKDDASPFAPSSLGPKFKKFCRDSGIREIRIHDLRHTSAVLALEAGIPLEAVSEGLGHSGVEITKRIYAPKVPGLGRRYSTELDQFLSNALPNADSQAKGEINA